MNKQRAFNLFVLTILVIASSFSVPIKPANAQGLGPIAVVFIENNHIVGFHWPVGTILTLTIDDPDTPAPVDYSDIETVLADPDPNVPGSTAARFWLGDEFRVKPGHIVTLSGGGITKTHTVTSLTRDGVNMPGDRLWGHADPGTVVEVRNRWQRDIVRWETANSTGYWEADFSSAGDLPEEALTHDFGLGTYFMIMQNDNDGDHTQYNWEMPFPTLIVQRTQNLVNGYRWPLGYPVSLTVDDPNRPGVEVSKSLDPIEEPDSEAGTGRVYLKLGSDFQVMPGHIVTLSNGFLARQFTVSTIQVTDIDLEADTVSGMAEPLAKVEVMLQYQQIHRRVEADAGGDWTADFSTPGSASDEQVLFDLTAWDEGTARAGNGDWGFTEVTWPNELNMSEGNRVSIYNWYAGELALLTIDDPSTPGEADFSASAYPAVGPWLYTYHDFDIGAFTMQPGHSVSLVQSSYSKTCNVVPVAVTAVDFIIDEISGLSSPSAQVQVNVSLGSGDEWARYRYARADETGHWIVNFSEPGTHHIRHSDETEIVDILPGLPIYASEGDDHACFTTVRWRLPVLRVRLTTGEIHAQYFTPGYPVALTVYQPDDLLNPVYTDTKIMGDDNLLIFDYPDTLDIGPGYLVRATNGMMTKEHTVTSAWIDGVDLVQDQVHGTAVAGTPVQVFACTTTLCAQRNLVTGSDSTWLADFSQPGPGEEEVVDLETAYLIVAFQEDDDGDRTRVHWALNQPPEIGAIAGPVAPVPVNTSMQVTASFTDPDIGDTHTAVWDWGDGTTSGGTVAEGSAQVSGNHAYSTAGIYTVQLTFCDAVGECDRAAYEFVVVYDPAGGFVTGGGWIWSPAGAYKADPMLEGKATFGFVSKYLKGANVPTGNTEFQFKASDLNFKSTSYQWLVVNKSSSNAQFKGYGPINGTGNYGFMLWATDSSPDTFRIKIWDATDETIIIYDNGVSQPIGGGSIVIHSK